MNAPPRWARTVTCKVSLHARPAALLAQRGREVEPPVWLVKDGQRVQAASLTGILSIEALAGTQVTVESEGPGAREAVEVIAGMIESGPDQPPTEGPDR
jgi:phosphotransferase system HPr (HPr) family protein